MTPVDDESGRTYLFAWNPENFAWDILNEQIQKVANTGAAEDSWSCGSVRNLPSGSRFFLIRLAAEPRGIVGAGITTSDVSERTHWDDERAAKGDTAELCGPKVRRAVQSSLPSRPFRVGNS